MTIPPTSAVSSQRSDQTSTQSTSNSATVDYNQFLKLLIAQMKNQDPTNPMDPTQQIAQLAAFSNVEQSVKINSKLDTMMSISALTQAESVIGRTVTTPDGEVTGKVVAMQVFQDGAIVMLEDGTQVALGPGVVIS
jgi:flagellar basal-body rod modification protein FlgD